MLTRFFSIHLIPMPFHSHFISSHFISCHFNPSLLFSFRFTYSIFQSHLISCKFIENAMVRAPPFPDLMILADDGLKLSRLVPSEDSIIAELGIFFWNHPISNIFQWYPMITQVSSNIIRTSSNTIQIENCNLESFTFGFRPGLFLSPTFFSPVIPAHLLSRAHPLAPAGQAPWHKKMDGSSNFSTLSWFDMFDKHTKMLKSLELIQTPENILLSLVCLKSLGS